MLAVADDADQRLQSHPSSGPSVLRSALMGSIALTSLAGGRSGRGLSFLCLAVIGLLLFDPGLGTSFGFLLSVLATLGIIVLGRRIVDLTPAVVPRWVAAAFAVPLSAQLLCGPVTVLLQPQFSTYALAANVMASPLVAPVTLLGTAAVPLVSHVPWAATALIAVAGTFSSGVAGTARFMAGLPGASLAWPEGVFGLRRISGILELLEQRVHVLRPGRNPIRPGTAWSDGPGVAGFRHCTNISRRNHEWPLRKPHGPGRRRPIRPPGGT